MDFIKEKIRVIADKLNSVKTLKKKEIDFLYTDCPEYKITNTPPADGWREFKKGDRVSGKDDHKWIHFKIDKIKKINGAEPRLTIKTGREGGWDASNPQFTVYLNGKTTQALDINHTWLPLEFGTDYDVYIYLYTGMEDGLFDVLISYEIIDTRIESLYYDIWIPYLSMNELDENDYNYIITRDHVDKALMLLDLRHIYSEDFYKSIDKTAKYLKEEFYEKICGKSYKGEINAVGQTHIDVAWLWSVAQTREKAQRSFSTVLNMMDRYDDYIFMSSQPQLYQQVKESDPEMYERIKEQIKKGRWEAEGAMWLESDTNLISGESLVRQIIFGKRFMREEFGVDNKILWLPDVFGYSAALPQILKKSGITQFFTTKLYWNETNTMPNDIFTWQGIDGSEVFALFRKYYNNLLNPHELKKTWDIYKNKSLSDTAFLSFGFGDGGGGPTYEMIEMYERLKHGLPGIPKITIKKAGEHFDKAEESFNQKCAELKVHPRWVGEIYLEMHRGTYTSIAKNKKNNRKSELLYQEAEAVSVTDMILAGGEYPCDTLRKNQQNILLNQFHDIIPGSSIKEVYDVTDKEYGIILGEGRKIVDDKISNIKKNINTSGGIFVYNPTPFEMSDYIKVDGNNYYAGNIPAHGWRVIEDLPVDMGVLADNKTIENDVIRVTFNEKYHIVSVYDKEENREIIANGAEGNVLEIFEDYPRDYDAWEITSYYVQKMWIADDVSKAEIIDGGIRIKRKYQKSEIVQEITLKTNSKRIDFKTMIDWHEDHVLLKAAFPVDIHNTYAAYDIQFGNVQRPTHKNTSWDAAKFEVCAHKWADLSEDGYGVSILNDCKYGYSIEENIMKISLLKAATYPNPEADRGIHEFTYSLYPHCGDFKEGETIKQAYLLNAPLEAEIILPNTAALSETYSLVSCDKENIVVETIKKAEDDNSVIIRMYESFNKKTDAKISLGFDFKECYITDLMENNIEKANSNGREVNLYVKNFEIVTLKFII